MSPNWLKLEQAVVEAFHDREDLRARARAMIAWLHEHSLDRPERVEDAARIAMAAGVEVAL
jgi:hypothetical protein